MIKTDEEICRKRAVVASGGEEGKIARIHEFCDLAPVATACA